MIKKIVLLLLISFTIVSTVYTQEYYRRDFKYVDTATFMIWASPAFAVQTPFGKGYLASTFNSNLCIGVDLSMKSHANWTVDVGFNYMFGSKIRKAPRDILGDIWFAHTVNANTSIPVIFNGAGHNQLVLTYEGRYLHFCTSVGKIIPLDRWKNSGLWVKIGVGYMEHKIHFTDPNHFFIQIANIKGKNRYRFGYDQRSSGIALNQFFGYLFMQKRRVLSFYVGVELWEIFSKPNRGYIFVGEYAGYTADLPRQFSGMVGARLGWLLPFHEKKRITTFYTY